MYIDLFCSALVFSLELTIEAMEGRPGTRDRHMAMLENMNVGR